MLKPDYLLHISEGAENIAEQLHVDIVNRIVERILYRVGNGEDYIMTPTDKWQIEVLQDSGVILEKIEQEISKKTHIQEREIRLAMEEAGVTALDYDDKIYHDAGLSPVPLMQSPHLIRIMQRNYDATIGEWKNFTRTTAENSQKTYINAMDKAYHLATSGAVTPTQAVQEVLMDVVSDGIKIKYPTGHEDTLETATLRAVRTGISQMSGQITDARMEEMDWDIILTSAHLGARVTEFEDFTNHFWWQGKFYSRTGRDARFPLWSVCGMGRAQGIHGINCRHSHGPGDGKNNPFADFDNEKNQKQYELEQRQRELERRIRKTKREVMNWKKAVDNAQSDRLKFENDLIYQRKSALLQKQNQAYNDFCEQNNLKRLADRLEVARWNREQSSGSRGAAQRYNNAR